MARVRLEEQQQRQANADGDASPPGRSGAAAGSHGGAPAAPAAATAAGKAGPQKQHSPDNKASPSAPGAGASAKPRQSLSELGASQAGPMLVDAAWHHERAVAAAKAVTKAQLGLLNEELQRHRVAVGDHLEGVVRGVDARIIECAGSAAEREGLLWERFEVLRTWTGLGVPPRAGIQ